MSVRLAYLRESRSIYSTHTVLETPAFAKQADKIWSEAERLDFISWLARNPLSGDVIPDAEGARKIRWSASGAGKRGGVRVIYFNRSREGLIYSIAIYRKSNRTNMTSAEIKRLP